jgi:uncharacterized membrane protein
MKTFGVSLVSFLVLDVLWLGFVVKDFNLQQLAQIGRINNGEFDLLLFPAAITYVLMSLAMVFFVVPKAAGSGRLGPAFGWGALMGLVVYGVFDMTNLAILRDYPVTFVYADMAWGTFVFGAVSAIVHKFEALTK